MILDSSITVVMDNCIAGLFGSIVILDSSITCYEYYCITGQFGSIVILDSSITPGKTSTQATGLVVL